jgi:DNA polymerase III subunit chi
MAEILFYHMTESRLEDALPSMLEKSLERGWRVVVEASSEDRVASLNAHLWTYTDDSFLPHGAAADGNSGLQPIFLTADDANPNGATVRFLVDGAMPKSCDGYQRIAILFDGHDNQQTTDARTEWKRLKADGHELTYWAQGANGRWEKRA